MILWLIYLILQIVATSRFLKIQTKLLCKYTTHFKLFREVHSKQGKSNVQEYDVPMIELLLCGTSEF